MLASAAFRGGQRRDFDDAVEEVVDYLGSAPEARSAAVFSRWGEYPMMLPLTFGVPLETQFHAGELPVIYPLVELKDRFNRFVLVVTNSEAARIFEINLGEVSETLMTERPELRRAAGPRVDPRALPEPPPPARPAVRQGEGCGDRAADGQARPQLAAAGGRTTLRQATAQRPAEASRGTGCRGDPQRGARVHAATGDRRGDPEFPADRSRGRATTRCACSTRRSAVAGWR